MVRGFVDVYAISFRSMTRNLFKSDEQRSYHAIRYIVFHQNIVYGLFGDICPKKKKKRLARAFFVRNRCNIYIGINALRSHKSLMRVSRVYIYTLRVIRHRSLGNEGKKKFGNQIRKSPLDPNVPFLKEEKKLHKLVRAPEGRRATIIIIIAAEGSPHESACRSPRRQTDYCHISHRFLIHEITSFTLKPSLR